MTFMKCHLAKIGALTQMAPPPNALGPVVGILLGGGPGNLATLGGPTKLAAAEPAGGFVGVGATGGAGLRVCVFLFGREG